MQSWIEDIFRHFQPIRIKKMFGGLGVFKDGLMFALVADDAVFLKTDSVSQSQFEQLGLKPFEYQKKDQLIQMSYWEAPESIYEDPDEAAAWALEAYEAALRSKAKK